MIDHLIVVPDEASAIADSNIGAYYTEEGGWCGDVCFPGIQRWKPAEDVTGTDSEGNPTVTHQYRPGFGLIVSDAEVVPELRDHPNCLLVWDRDAEALVASQLTIEELAEYMISPVPAGSAYPFGNPG